MWSREDRRTLVLLLPLLVLAVAAFLLLEPKTPRSGAPPDAAKEAPPELFEFDPNTVDYRALRRLGFTKQDAAGVLRYRAAGKIFRIPEDFAACYQVSDSMYDRLEPYIRIGAEYRFRPRRDSAQRLRKPFVRRQRVVVPLVPFRIDTMTAKFLRAIGFTKRQAEAIADYKHPHRRFPRRGGVVRLSDYRRFGGPTFGRVRPLPRTAASAARSGGAEYGRLGGAAFGQRYRCEDRRGDSRLPAAAGRFLQIGRASCRERV